MGRALISTRVLSLNDGGGLHVGGLMQDSSSLPQQDNMFTPSAQNCSQLKFVLYLPLHEASAVPFKVE